MKRRAIVSVTLFFTLSYIFPAATIYALDNETTQEPPTAIEQVVSDEQTTDEVTTPPDTTPALDTPLQPIAVDPSPAMDELTPPNNAVVASVMMETVAPPASHEGVVISLVQTRGASGNASDELIELYNNSDSSVDVTDWCLKRASATGTSYTKMVCLTAEQTGKEFRVILPARSSVLAVSAVSSLTGFDLQFSAGLSDTGGRIGLFNNLDERQDLFGWGAATIESETTPFAITSARAPLQRKSLSPGVQQDTDNNASDFETSTFRSLYAHGALVDDSDYCLNIDGLQANVPDGWSRDSATGNCENTPVNVCPGLVLSEIGANMSGQFIELYNSGAEPLSVADCKIQTNRSDDQQNLANQILEPHAFVLLNIAETNLTLTKTTTGTVYLLSSDGATELDSTRYQDIAEDTSWAWFGGSDWRQTYVMTPGEANVYQQYAACQAGYERNPSTGMCRKIEIATSYTACKEGQYRSDETNRCRSIASAAASVLKPCADDQFRNPATNRCKTIASSDDVVDCGEGRERNPTTNRCRNVVRSDVPAAAFAVEPIKDGASAFVGWWALGGVASVALGYGGWEWRREVLAALHQASMLFRAKR